MLVKLRTFSCFITLFVFLQWSSSNQMIAQTITVGEGSYSTSLPAGAVGPSYANGGNASPKVTEDFSQPFKTNHFWSSLIFPFRENPHSNNMFAHPLNLKAVSNGLEMGYTNTHILAGDDYLYPYSKQLTVGVSGLTASETLTKHYGDWTVTALWDNGSATMEATFGHGLPFVFFEISGGNATINTSAIPTVWYNTDEVLGITVSGKHYGIFAPSGSSWSGTDDFESSLNGKGFFSVALLPDNSTETLELFRSHAYAFVTNSTASWEYDEQTSTLTTTYSYETELKDSSDSNVDETLTALYRHQWLHVNEAMTSHAYQTARGEMKLYEGSTFTTDMMFSGILPAMPDAGSYDRFQLINFVKEVATETLGGGNTYGNGKTMGRFAQLVPIADQLGLIAERDYFLSQIKARLENWLTVGNDQEYSYIEEWDALIGYPSGFGADRELNDHHFHASYAIYTASVIAQYDSAWAAQENWGGMINLLVSNASNWNRENTMFPYLRNFDVYAGHSWAAGHADFGDGNNQESSSESMNYASATFLWGLATGQQEIRDLGVFLYTTEASAIEQYWFDVDDVNFPANYSKKALGIVWGGKGTHGTWFGNSPEFIHGINFLPITSASVYLGRHPDYILENYAEIVAERGGQPNTWKDVMWSYLALSDAEQAIEYYEADPDYEVFDGESRAHTMHWLYNLKELGHFNTTVFADVPTYAVFVNADDDTTYIAYNPDNTERVVTFTDGFELIIPAKEMKYASTKVTEYPQGPAPDPTENENNVLSIFSDSYPPVVEADFTVLEDQTTATQIVLIESNNTLKYSNLDYQTTALFSSIDVSSRTSFHVDYYTEDATNLAVFLVSEDQEEKQFDLTVPTNEWQSLKIPLSEFSDVVDLTAIRRIRFEGNGTVLVDNLYFSGDAPLPSGPNELATAPILGEDFVISIYSDSYGNMDGLNTNPNWGQSTVTTEVSIGEDSFLKYDGLNYQGTDFGQHVDATDMEWFHLDYWTDNATELNVYLVSPGPLETPVQIDIQTGEWVGVDIPLSEYADVVNLSEVFQIKITGNGTIYFDNFYFGKLPALTEAPAPIHDSEKVVSLFSDSYNNISVDTWSAGWDRADVEDVVMGENTMKHYTNLTFAGIEFIREMIDGTNLTHLHFDMWTPDATTAPATFKVKLVDFGANAAWSGGDDVEHTLTFTESTTPALQPFTWISFDIPIDDFEEMTTRAHLSQLLFEGSAHINEVYIDNLYFFGDQIINSSETEEELPTSMELAQNYPNPFNPSTNIQFGIPEASQVSLTIYNPLGQKVATLISERMSAGSYTITWDASNAPSGVYFYRLDAGGSSSTKKMLLIK